MPHALWKRACLLPLRFQSAHFVYLIRWWGVRGGGGGEHCLVYVLDLNFQDRLYDLFLISPFASGVKKKRLSNHRSALHRHFQCPDNVFFCPPQTKRVNVTEMNTAVTSSHNASSTILSLLFCYEDFFIRSRARPCS